MASFFAFLLAMFKAIPALKSLWEQFSAYYIQQQIANMEKENVDAIRKAIQNHDQRDLEKAIGNPNPGLPSGDAGTIIIDRPPPNV